MTNYAEGMAAAWRLLVAVPDPVPEPRAWEATREATAYMAKRLSRPATSPISRRWPKSWDGTVAAKYLALIKGLENLAHFNDAASINEPTDVLNVIRDLADDFESCLPQTSEYFVGLWRPPA